MKQNSIITPGVLKSIDSAFTVVNNKHDLYYIKYKGEFFNQNSNNVRLYLNLGAAKSNINAFLMSMFRQGEYWQSCSTQIKSRSNYDVDFSATIAILPSSGLTSRFDSKETKKTIKNLVEELLELKIFTIEKLI